MKNLGLFDFSKDPIENFELNLAAAAKAAVVEPTAMALATVNSEGRPTNRMVLYKGLIRGQPSFFTNYASSKSQDLDKCPFVAATFFWASLAQQIRFEGQVEKLSRQESEEYFKTRPRLSQEGAWASQQSQILASTEFLKNQLLEVQKKFEGREISCPPNWGGYLLVPHRIEFWFGQQGRLHDRYLYIRDQSGNSEKEIWKRQMLCP